MVWDSNRARTDRTVKQLFRYAMINFISRQTPAKYEFLIEIINCLLALNNKQKFCDPKQELSEKGIDYDKIIALMNDRSLRERYGVINSMESGLAGLPCKTSIEKELRQKIQQELIPAMIGLPMINDQIFWLFEVLVSKTDLANTPIPSNDILRARYDKIKFSIDDQHQQYPGGE